MEIGVKVCSITLFKKKAGAFMASFLLDSYRIALKKRFISLKGKISVTFAI